ncbi:hypothetical protein GOP47_0018079 [Adiantum capillus-veneris]|uniref:Uncharacterized protein n=1 Tax=Adiantum capillus-veneris TaxID=13818 RepID=A0A9D4UGM8_ADICA|nr:hypothetical protein GOP47_0018079 [Adiantum capillus-veneris]
MDSQARLACPSDVPSSTSRSTRRHAPSSAQQPSPSPPPESEDDNPAQQQQVLESLASYLEGELVSRLQAYSELLAEVFFKSSGLALFFLGVLFTG